MKYFTMGELLRSSSADSLGIDNTCDITSASALMALVDNVLDPLREWYGKPIYVNSGYRCKELNTAIGGAPTSQHMKGEAVWFLMVLLFPLGPRFHLFIQTGVALVAAWGDDAVLHGLAHSTPPFLQVRAPHKSALLQVGSKLPEGVRQFFFGDELHLLHIEGGKARGVCHQPTAYPEQLHMAGGMTASPQFFTDLPHLQVELGTQGIEHTGFSHTGVAGKRGDLSMEHLQQLCQSFSRAGADGKGLKACAAIQLHQLVSGLQIPLIEADDGLTALVLCQ